MIGFIAQALQAAATRRVRMKPKINLTVLAAYQAAANAMAEAIDMHTAAVLAGRSDGGYRRLTAFEAYMSEACADYKVARRDFEDMMDGAA